MANPIKYSTGSETKSLKKGNFFFGTGDVGKGPSDVTGYYQGVDVPQPGYVVYQYLESSASNLTYAALNSDAELINFTNGIADESFTSVAQCFTYYATQNDKVCFNRDYEPIVTDGLILNVDAGFDGSYPASGNTWRDLSVSGNNGTLINSPGFYDNGGGGIVFDGVDDYFFKDIGFYSTFTLSVWVYPVSGQSFLQYGRHPQNFTPLLFINASTTTLVVYTNDYYQSFTNSIVLNSWNLITVVASTDTSLREIYVNGISKGSNTFSILGVTNGELTLGRGYASQYANCRISSVLFYNRTLTSSEVLQNYNAMKDRFAFIFTVDTTKAGTTSSTQFKLPLVSSGSVNFVVEWGDGTTDTITTFNQAQTTHTYSSEGTYEIKIRGIIRGWRFDNGGDKLKMGVIKNWGCLDISVNSGFYGCTNMSCVANDAPVITSTSLYRLFRDCYNFNGVIGNWDVSNVTQIFETFWGASSFNADIGSWDVSNVTFLANSFNNTPFNQNIGSWDVSNVTTMGNLFLNAYAFNNGNSPDINNWDTSSVTSMFGMFNGATAFNQNIGAWDVSKVTAFQNMFSNATAFNNGGSDDIDNWVFSTTSNISMDQMFGGNTTNNSCKFNRYIGSWNTERVTSMSSMFAFNTVFNQNIGAWNTGNVTSMFRMFQSTDSFNQNIGAWDVSNVNNMNGMFDNAKAFNQDINTKTINAGLPNEYIAWDTSSVTSMSRMFAVANAFNQDIGGWNVSNVTNFSTFMGNKTAASFSAANLDSIYNNWSLLTLKPNINITFGSIKYNSTAQSGRDVLTSSPNNWTITDGGQV
jgi:surface protein